MAVSIKLSRQAFVVAWAALWLGLLCIVGLTALSRNVLTSGESARGSSTADRAASRFYDAEPPGNRSSRSNESAVPIVPVTDRARDPQVRPRSGEVAIVYGAWDEGGWTDLYGEDGGEGRRLGQLLLGDPVSVLEDQDEWSHVRVPEFDDMTGWVRAAELTVGSENVIAQYSGSQRATILQVPGIQVAGGPLIPFGAKLPVVRWRPGVDVTILLPDGREAIVKASPYPGVASAVTLSDAIRRAANFRRASFQVGANIGSAMDGAGLAYLVHRVAGTRIPRAVSSQLVAGETVQPGQFQRGDVLFLQTFDPARAQPVILVDEMQTYLASRPAAGVVIGRLEDLRNRRLVAAKRFR